MGTKVRIAVYTGGKEEPSPVCSLLNIWAESTCVSIEVFIRSFDELPETKERYEIIFVGGTALDIRTIMQLRNVFPECGLIMLTDDRKLAVDVYSCHPNALIPSLPTYAELDAAMERCFHCWREGIKWLELPLRHRRINIPIYKLYYVEAAKHNSVLHNSGGTLRVSCSLSDLEKQLPSPPYVRCQKSFVVNISAVSSITGGELIMRDGETIAVARRYMQDFQKSFQDYKMRLFVCMGSGRC